MVTYVSVVMGLEDMEGQKIQFAMWLAWVTRQEHVEHSGIMLFIQLVSNLKISVGGI